TTIGVIDLAARGITGNIRVAGENESPGLRDMRLSPDGAQLYVVSHEYYSSPRLLLIDTGSNTLTGAIALPEIPPDSVVVAGDGDYAFVTQEDPFVAFISIIDLRKRSWRRSIDLPSNRGFNASLHARLALLADGTTA